MDDIINYTMENPGNTNPNVLRSMLENYGGGGGALIVNIVPEGMVVLTKLLARSCPLFRAAGPS